MKDTSWGDINPFSISLVIDSPSVENFKEIKDKVQKGEIEAILKDNSFSKTVYDFGWKEVGEQKDYLFIDQTDNLFKTSLILNCAKKIVVADYRPTHKEDVYFFPKVIEKMERHHLRMCDNPSITWGEMDVSKSEAKFMVEFFDHKRLLGFLNSLNRTDYFYKQQTDN